MDGSIFPIRSALRALPLVALAVAAGCVARAVTPRETARPDYLTAPVYAASAELERAFQSVHRIAFTARYTTYLFSEASGVTEGDVSRGGFEARADTSFAQTISKAGTATVVSRFGSRVTLLTVSHILRAPALRVRFYEDPAGTGRRLTDRSRRVASASIRVAEQGWLVPRFGDPLPLEVDAMDERDDLALLHADLPSQINPQRFPVLHVDAGDAHRLAWGSFLYALGYPHGYPLVTGMLVSSPNRDGDGAFVCDGIWHEGMSGGLILAIRASTGALELVGLARANAADSEIRLVPDTTGITPSSTILLFNGPLWLEPGLRSVFGIALPIPVTTIQRFLRKEEVQLGGDG